MSHREQVEQQIAEVLTTETDTIALSDKLFHRGGLFNQLAKTEDERRVVAQSSLFEQAQRRLTELQRREAAKFAIAVSPAQTVMSEGRFLLKLERADALERSKS